MKRLLCGLATAAICLYCTLAAVIVMGATASAADATEPQYDIVDGIRVSKVFDVDSIQELNDLIASDTPMTIIIDSTTGTLVEVNSTEHIINMTAPQISRIGVRNSCLTSDVCLYSAQYAEKGFYGKGIKTGQWASAKSFFSGNWTVQITWKNSGKTHTSPKTGANKRTLLTSGSNTVTKVQIF